MPVPLYVNIERLCTEHVHPLTRALARQVRLRQHCTLGAWLERLSDAELDEVSRLCSAARVGEEPALREALLLALTLALAEGLEVTHPEQAIAMLDALSVACDLAKLARRGELVLRWERLSLDPEAALPVRLSDAGYRRLERRARG